MKRRHTEKGMALVITLMMLAIVTFMAVVFLSLSRRERTNVKTMEDQATARQMADAGLERAKADLTANMVDKVEKFLALASPIYGDTNKQHDIAIANRAVQNGLFQYDLRTSRNFFNPAGFKRSEQGNPWNVGWDLAGNPIDNKGAILGATSDDYYRQIANLQYDPRPPVTVTDGKTNDNRFYIDLNRNGMYDAGGFFKVTGPNNEEYAPNGRIGKGLNATFVGDPEWIGVLERPDLPHSETNRFIGRYAYLMMPTGKSLDINFIHNLAAYTGNSTDLKYSGTTPHFSRNQGVGSWELNLAAFLIDFHTNEWKSTSSSFYNYTTNQASGFAFRDAVGLLQYRLNNSRANLLTPQQMFTNTVNTIWKNDNVDMASDGPFVPYGNVAFSRAFLTDNDDSSRYWHGGEQADKTGEFADVQRYFKLSTPTASSEQLGFYGRFIDAVASARTNTYDRYAYYRLLSQMGADSKPATQGKIHLNYISEPGTIPTNFLSWASSTGPVSVVRPPISISWNVTSNRLAIPSDPEYQVQVRTTNSTLTNFFLIAADAMLKADLVTNVYLDRTNLSSQSRVGMRTNYTVGASYFDNPALNAIDPTVPGYGSNPNFTRVVVNTPVRPDISVTNIQIFYLPHTNLATWVANDLTYTNNEYTPEVHRVLQLAANIYDSMTNNPGRRNSHRADDPFFPTVFRPLYAVTYTNISIIGWEPQDTAAFANTHTTNMVSMSDFFFSNRPTLGAPPTIWTNINFYGQPWVIGAKKGWPNFNELSIENYIQVTRKLDIIKDKPGDKVQLTNYNALATHTMQIFEIGFSNTFGLEAWNSYAVANHRTIRIDAEIDATFSIDRIDQRDGNSNVVRWHQAFVTPTVARMRGGFTIPGATGWPGRQGDMALTNAMAKSATPTIADGISDFRVPIYTNAAVFPALPGVDPFAPREYDDSPPRYGSFFTNARFMPIANTPDLRLNITNRVRYLAVDATENRVIDYVTMDNLVTSVDLGSALKGNPTTASTIAAGGGQTDALKNALNGPWLATALGDPKLGLTQGILQQIITSLSDTPPAANMWRAFNTADSLDKQIKDFQDYINGVNTNGTVATNVERQVPFSPTRTVYIQNLYQANDPFVHYMPSDLIDYRISPTAQTITPGTVVHNAELGKRNTRRQNKHIDFAHGPAFQDPGVQESDDWQFPIAKLDNSVGSSSRYGITNFQYRFPGIGALGQVHRGTPWQTVYLKAGIAPNFPDQKVPLYTQNPVSWSEWSGAFSTHPTNDWKFVGLFTTALSDNAARGLLSVNQTNMAAWSAVLCGVPVITNTMFDNQVHNIRLGGTNNVAVYPRFGDQFIQPGSTQLLAIVKSINQYRSLQPMGSFSYLGEVLGAPALSAGTGLPPNPIAYYGTNIVGSPVLNLRPAQVVNNGSQVPWPAFTDEALEALPQRILSLLKEDEPRVTIYCFGQTLKPAPRSLVTSADFYNLCVNYQVTGEYVTKAVVRVEGEMKNPNNPLRTVVESFEVLPPFE